jgi:Rieske Fe-S protein
MNIPDDATAPPVQRRSLLGFLIGAIGAGITATLGITIGRFSIAPAFSKASAATWIEVGPLSAIPENQLLRKNITVTQEAGWGRFNATRLLWIIRKGEAVTIFSGVCPHLGCTVNAKEETFICACHGSKWEPSGQKVAGPAPRNLDTLEHKTENGILKVNYQDFKQGTATKEVLV